MDSDSIEDVGGQGNQINTYYGWQSEIHSSTVGERTTACKTCDAGKYILASDVSVVNHDEASDCKECPAGQTSGPSSGGHVAGANNGDGTSTGQQAGFFRCLLLRMQHGQHRQFVQKKEWMIHMQWYML